MVTCWPASEVPTPSRGHETRERTSTYGGSGVGFGTTPSKTYGRFGFAASSVSATWACVSSSRSVIADLVRTPGLGDIGRSPGSGRSNIGRSLGLGLADYPPRVDDLAYSV